MTPRHPAARPHQMAIGEAIQTTIEGEDHPARMVAAAAAHDAATRAAEQRAADDREAGKE